MTGNVKQQIGQVKVFYETIEGISNDAKFLSENCKPTGKEIYELSRYKKKMKKFLILGSNIRSKAYVHAKC